MSEESGVLVVGELSDGGLTPYAIGVVEFDVSGNRKVGVTPGSARAREVLRALGLS